MNTFNHEWQIAQGISETISDALPNDSRNKKSVDAISILHVLANIPLNKIHQLVCAVEKYKGLPQESKDNVDSAIRSKFTSLY